jgi:hypothetical protein
MTAKVKPVAVANFKRARGASAVILTPAAAVLACSTIALAQNSDTKINPIRVRTTNSPAGSEAIGASVKADSNKETSL